MNPTHRLATLTLMLGLAANAHSQSSPDEMRQATYLAGNCANCHGTAGKSATPQMPGLAGQSKDKLAQSMRDFRDGKRAATIMHQLAKGYSDKQIDLLAEYFSRQKAN